MSRLSRDTLCSSLLILHQHGCLITELPPNLISSSLPDSKIPFKSLESKKGINDNARLIYSVDIDMVLNRLQIGCLVWQAKHAVDAAHIGELLMEELFMNGRQSFQQLRAEVDARLRSRVTERAATSSGAEVLQIEEIQACFDSLAEKGFIVPAELHKPRRQTLPSLPPKSKGAKNKRHLGLDNADSRKKRKRDSNDNDDDDDDDDVAGNDDDNDDDNDYDDDHEPPREMRMLSDMRHSRARDAATVFETGRFVGDGEWKEDTGFGPITEEVIFDTEANEAIRRALVGAPDISQFGAASAASKVADSKELVAEPKVTIKEELVAGSAARRGLVVLSDDDCEDESSLEHKEAAAEPKVYSSGSIDRGASMWTVGWSQLFAEERHNECVRYTTERMQFKAGRIMRILLDASHQGCPPRRHPTTPTERSSPMKINTILDEYRRLCELGAKNGSASGGGEEAAVLNNDMNVGNDDVSSSSTLIRDPGAADVVAMPTAKVPEKPLDLPTLRKLLQILVEDRCITETNSTVGGSAAVKEYQANVGEIIHRMRRKTIQSVAAQRFGVPAARIVELLTASDELIEQGRMSDVAIMPAREARENLYKLYR